MSTIAQLKTANDTVIRQKVAAGSITTDNDADLRDLYADEMLERGIFSVADTTALSAQSGANLKLVFVKNNGLFVYEGAGSPNGTTIFAATGGGVYKRYLAEGSGTNILYARDYASLQDAIDALVASGTANILELEKGKTYNIVSDITFTATGKIIEGNGCTFNVNYVTANPAGIKLWTGSTYCEIRNINFVGVGTAGSIGVWCNGVVKCQIIGCSFTGFQWAINYGSGNAYNRITNCRFFTNDYGLYLYSEYCLVSNCYFTGNTFYAISILGGNNIITGNLIVYNAGGIEVVGGISNSDHGSIIGNSINHNTNVGIHIKNLQFGMGVLNNEIWASITGTLAGKGSAYGIYIENSPKVRVVGNSISHNKISIGLEGITLSFITSNMFLADGVNVARHIREVGGTNADYLISGNVLIDDLTGGNTVNLATDCPNATLANNIVS